MKLLFRYLSCFLIVGLMGLCLISCEKDKHVPPTITLKATAGYTSGDATVAKNTLIKVGIVAEKVEDDMLSYNVSYAFDGAATTTTLQTFSLNDAEHLHYDKDVSFTTRNQAGMEKWSFTITDKDGNIAQKQIVLTVQ